jgi:hypothetical protein
MMRFKMDGQTDEVIVKVSMKNADDGTVRIFLDDVFVAFFCNINHKLLLPVIAYEKQEYLRAKGVKVENQRIMAD